ncbi:MAG: RNA polymerase-binding protein DksA [Nitrospinae bacterium]|nr:RNA polymerase-binding protein DksA [Nitrospinota bacterium]
MSKINLDFFRQALEKQREDIVKEATESANGGISANSEELPDVVDRSSLETDRNFTLRLLDRDRKLIKKIEEAIGRIEAGEFGHCEDCGGEIGEERLKARPVATLCIGCKEEQERKEKAR